MLNFEDLTPAGKRVALGDYINIQDTTDRIRNWAIMRELDDADPHKQALKLGEEFGELCQGLAKDRIDETKDAIGDMFVVLTILSMQIGTSVEECADIAYNEIKYRQGKMINGVFVKEADL